MEEVVEIVSISYTVEGRKTLEGLKEFIRWAYHGAFKNSELFIKRSKENDGMVSVYVPKSMQMDLLPLCINYALQKGITNGLIYYTNSSICDMQRDINDVKNYLAMQKSGDETGRENK